MSDLLPHNHLALIFFPALLLSLWLTPVVIRYSVRLNTVDRPSERKVHKKAVSRMGGAAMVAGLVLPLLFFSPLDRTMLQFFAGVFLVTATGFLDDVYHIPPVAKFAGEIAASGAFVFLSGISVQEFGDLFGTGAIAIGLAVPIVALPVVPPAFGGIAAGVLTFVAAQFPWRAQRSRPSVAYGLMWLACLCLLAMLQAIPGSPAWVPAYLAMLSAAVFLWVLLKMKYHGHRQIVQISSFELLLLGVVLFVALVMLPALHMGNGLWNEWRTGF